MRKVKNPAKKNTSAWRKRQKQKIYRKYQNIVHNNVKNGMKFMYYSASRKRRSIILPVLLRTLAEMTQHRPYDETSPRK